MNQKRIPLRICRTCDNCFSIVPYEAVLCKKGEKKDIIIKRPKNNWSKYFKNKDGQKNTK